MTVDAGLVDLLLLVVALEAAALLAWSGLRGGFSPADFAFNLGAGAALMIALRMALGGSGDGWIGGALALALVLHLADLARRLRRPRSGAVQPG